MSCHHVSVQQPHLGEALDDLARGEALGKGLRGVLPVQEHNRIASLRRTVALYCCRANRLPAARASARGVHIG